MESYDPTSEIELLFAQLFDQLDQKSYDQEVQKKIIAMIDKIKLKISRLAKEGNTSYKQFELILYSAELDFYEKISDECKAEKIRNFIEEQNGKMNSVGNESDMCSSSDFNFSLSCEYYKMNKKEINTSLEKIFTQLQKLFPDNPDLIDLKEKLNQIFGTPPITKLHNFQSFLSEETVLSIVINRMLDSLESKQNMEKIAVSQLQQLFISFCTEMKINFIVYLYGCEDKKLVLLENISPMKAKSHMKLLLKMFHPDKCQWCDISLISALFSSIKDLEGQVMAEMRIDGNLSDINQYEELAKRSYQYAQDLRQAIVDKKANHSVKMKEIQNLTKTEVENLCTKYANEAYDYYKLCCIIADEDSSLLLKSVHYRRELAKCKLISQRPLEAQICLLSAALLLINKSNVNNPGFDFQMEQNVQLMENIKGTMKTSNTPDNDCQVLVPVDTYKHLSFFKLEELKSSISEHMKSLCKALVLRTSSGVIPYTVPTDAGLFLVDLNLPVLSFYPVSLGLFLLSYIPGFTFFLSITRNTRKQKIFNILKNSIKYFEKGNFSEFLKEMSQNYGSNKCLVNFNKKNLDIQLDIQSFCKVLLENDCAPDGIFLVLNILGESLLAEYVNSQDEYNLKYLLMKIEAIFNFIWNDGEYLQKAADIDNLKLKYQENKASTFEKIKITAGAALKGKMSELIFARFTKPGENNTVVERLNEIKLLAKLNLALINMFITFKTSKTETHLNDIKVFLQKNPSLLYSHFTRLDDINDLFWILTGKEQKELDIVERRNDVNNNNNKFDSEFLIRISSSIAQAKTKEEKIQILLANANYIISENEKNDSNIILSLKNWKEALIIFEEALKLDKSSNQAIILGKAKCLLHLCKFQEVEKCLSKQNNPNAEMFFVQACANRKLLRYDLARQYLNKAINLDPHNETYFQEMKILKNLFQTKKLEKIEAYNSAELTIEESFYNDKKSKDSAFFKILSIDGGGIRGLLPALWLTEIERLAKRPISHLFNLFAGTSTGAIIASALSVPSISDNQPSYYTPQYKAYDIVKLYKEEKDKIFQGNGMLSAVLNIFGPKYDETGRRNIFQKYFGKLKLSNCLAAGVFIPAVCENRIMDMKFFSSFDSIIYDQKNFSIVDVLMATTAAPSFFIPHEIKNEGIFTDGGILLNNPAKKAYLFSIENGLANHENIFVLSLGTGSYIPDPLDPSPSRGLMFWASNLKDVIFPLQELEIDKDMTGILEQNYQKWQVFLDHPIPFDDVSDQAIENLEEYAFQYIEEITNSGQLNKLIEFLLEF